MGGLEHATLAWNLVDDVAFARVRNVLTEHNHQVIALHFVSECAVDRGDHRLWISLRRRRSIEGDQKWGRRRANIHTSRPIPESVSGLDRTIGRVGDFCFHAAANVLELLLGGKAVREKELGKLCYGITRRLELTLFDRLIVPLVVGVRVRVRDG